jgi:hypothetical protein
MFEYNMNEDERNEMLGIKKENFGGGCARFDNVDYKTLKDLVDLNYADLEDAQNSAPTLGEFLKFIETHSNFTVHGYAISSDRDDYRISIEGVDGDHCSKQDQEDFTNFCTIPDEFARGIHCHCWYD